jgi:ABC-2 type transport system permease protein
MRIVLLVALKDLRQRLRDRTALLVSVVAPLGLAVIFSQLLAGATDFRAVYVVADMDGGPLATVLRKDVIGSLEGGDTFRVADMPTEAAARAAVADGTADAAFLVPAGFSAAIGAGQAVTLEVVGARDAGLATEIARAVAQRFGDGVVTVQLSVATATELARASGAGRSGGLAPVATLDPALQARIVGAASSARPPVVLADQTAALRQLSLASYFSASMAILFLFFSAQMGLVSLFDERRQGTLARILAGPVKPWSVLGGKLLGGFVQGMLAMTVLVVATTLLIGASWGSPLGVALVCTSAVIAALGISTLVISFTNSAEVAGAASSAVAITLGVLGGTFSPTAQGPEIMGTIALITPHGWFMRGLGDMQGGGTVADGLPAVGVLLAMGLVTGGIGMVRARRLVKAR